MLGWEYVNEITKWRSGEVSGLLQWRLASNHFEWQEYVGQKLRPRHQNRPTVIFLLNSRTKKRISVKSAAPLVGTPKCEQKCVDCTQESNTPSACGGGAVGINHSKWPATSPLRDVEVCPRLPRECRDLGIRLQTPVPSSRSGELQA